MNQREASLDNWRLNGDRPTVEEINAGSLQRIADAVEKMTSSYAELLAELKMADANLTAMHNAMKAEQEGRFYAERRIQALRGHITRLKNKGKP
jgi:hypothetical protein